MEDDGSVTGTGPDAALVSKRENYEDLTLQAELSASADVEAYVGCRLRRGPNLAWIGPVAAVSGNGSLVHAGAHAYLPGKSNPGANVPLFKPNEHFTLRVRAAGPFFWILVNGKLTIGAGGQVPVGSIGLFVTKGTLKIHKVAIKDEPL
jgi:hypothetical protein